jgi:hypothetical protein
VLYTVWCLSKLYTDKSVDENNLEMFSKKKNKNKKRKKKQHR